MKKRILDYMKKTDELLQADLTPEQWEQCREEHLIQIHFFQHERLIHLLVTITFAILTMCVFLFCLANFSIMLLVLTLLLLTLLIPYINHYYLLENGVQKMYEQYDKMLQK